MSKRKQKSIPTKKSPPKHKFEGKLSLVIPCYNESKRIGNLANTLKDFDKKWNLPLEFILVDDGSSDDTAVKIIDSFEGAFSSNTDFELVKLEQNAGKGGALKAGVEKATGDYILTLDADMATKPIVLKRWLAKLPQKDFNDQEILIGSREHEDSKVEGQPLRRIAGLVFNFIIQLFTNINLRDTQCGFKLYPSAIGKQLFADLKTNGWAHDVELLYRAKMEGYSIQSMPITWTHQDDSKISLFSDSIKMFWQTMMISLRLNWDYFVVQPFKNFKTAKGENPIFRFLFLAVSVLLLFLMPSLSKDYGMTGDELAQKTYGEFIYKHYETDGKFINEEEGKYKGENALTMSPNLYYYGGLFDYTAAWLNENFGSGDEYAMRHWLNAIFGFIMIFFTALLAKEISGSWRVAFIALLFIALSPRIFGHSMNNPKDIPFAAAYAFTLLYLIRFIKQLPRPGTKTIVMLIIGVAASINVRVGGILLIAYLGLFTGLSYLFRDNLKVKLKNIPHLLKIAGIGLFVAIGGYLGGLLFWPWGAQAPFKNPLTALSEMSNFSTSIRMLFEGKHLWSDELPWYYIPKYFSIATPIVILIGALLFLIFVFTKYNHQKRLPLVLLAFAGVFPIAYAIYKHSSLYDGMRHFLFVYPVLVVVAAWGWNQLINFKPNPTIKYAVGGVMALLLALPLKSMITQHPYQYIYFNELSGGLKKASTNYEMDYWMNSIKGMSKWLAENDERLKKGEPVNIITNCSDPAIHYLKSLAPSAVVRYARYYDRLKYPADYYMFIPRFVNESHIESGVFPPADVVYEEKINGVTIGAISKRVATTEKDAADAEKTKNYQEAIRLYKQEIAQRPKNDAALVGLIKCYQQTRDWPNMKTTVDQLLAIGETYNSAHYYDGIYYLNVADQQNAKGALERAVDLNYKNSGAHYFLANIYGQESNAAKVVEHIKLYDSTGGTIPAAYDSGIAAANQTGERALSLYFQAKKAYLAKDYQGSFNLVKQSLRIDDSFKPAVELNKVYEESLK